MSYNDYCIIYPNINNTFSLYKIITFDTETIRKMNGNIEIQTMYNCDFYDGYNHYYTEDMNDVENIIFMLFKKYKKLTFFAHNIVFDLRVIHFLTKMIDNKLFNLRAKIKLMDNVFFVSFKSANREFVIQFADSRNYFRAALENLAELLNEEKENVNEYAYPIVIWNDNLKTNGKVRVQKDTEILYRVLEKFINNEDFNISYTLAGSSLKTFKMKYLKTPIIFPKSISDITLQAYSGGIVMPYKLVKHKQLYYYDINSLYPYVMKNNLYSVKYKGKLTNYRYIYDDIKNKAYNYLVKVKYEIKDWSPIYENYDNSLIPFLENEKWITGNELYELYINNANILIEEIHHFKNDDIFSEFVDYFYNKRMHSEKYEKFFYKIFLNSLYGKFGQHRGHSNIIKIDSIEDIAERIEIENAIKEGKHRIRLNDKDISLYDTFISYIEEGEIRYSPIIASEITANARIVNFHYSQMFGFDHLYYTDTDSFAVDKEYSELESKELGKLKLEKSGLFTIYAAKDYEYYTNCGECENCKWNGKSWHQTIKGVEDKNSVINNTYIRKKWSKLKYEINDDIYISKSIQDLNRLNKKLYYVNGIGREWINKSEYDNGNSASLINKNTINITITNEH